MYLLTWYSYMHIGNSYGLRVNIANILYYFKAALRVKQGME